MGNEFHKDLFQQALDTMVFNQIWQEYVENNG